MRKLANIKIIGKKKQKDFLICANVNTKHTQLPQDFRVNGIGF